jgi:hypothetical protein
MIISRTKYKMSEMVEEDGVVVMLLGRKTSSASSLAEVYISPGSPHRLSPILPRTQRTLPLFLHLDRYISPCPTLLLPAVSSSQ